MGRCCYCEGMYLTPQQRKEENPRLGMHVSCFLALWREIQDFEIIREHLAKNSSNEVLAAHLKRMDDFWDRMAKIDAFHKELKQQQSLITKSLTVVQEKTDGVTKE